jgi:hypothetical protein
MTKSEPQKPHQSAVLLIGMLFTLTEVRERRAAAVAALPRGVCVLTGRPQAYPVGWSAALEALVERARAAVAPPTRS